MPHLPPPADNDEVMQRILYHLERMDRRDRLRTIGGTFRSLLALIPLVLFLASTWYLYQNSDQIITKITQEAAKQASAYTQQESADMMERLQKLMPQR